MRVLAVSLLALMSACGSRSRSADEVVSPEPRRVLPLPVRTAPAGSSASAPSDAGARPSDEGPPFPRLVSLDAFGDADRVADLAALPLGDRILLGWVTYFDPNGVSSTKTLRSREKQATVKQGASVMVRVLDAAAEPLGPPTVISVKADSVGGVALAQAATPREGAVLAWVGKDGGVGQVFVTRISPSGEKQTQRMLTHTKGGCSDVTVIAMAGGWLVGWLDSHDGAADVNVARVGKDVARVGSERRIAQVKGEASELRLVARGDDVVLAWNEARADAALSGLFAVRLASADLAPIGDPVRVVQASPHARGLDVSQFEDGLVLGWTEDGTLGKRETDKKETDTKRVVALARLDGSLRAMGEPIRPALASDPRAIAVDCDRVCHVVVPSADQDQLLFYGFGYDGGRSTDSPARLSAVTGASTEDVSPVLVGDWLFFAEDNLHGGGRLRRARIAWR